MNPVVKVKLLAALRSGEYEQGFDMLCSPDDKFCCLGVLTDLYAKEHNIEWEDGVKSENIQCKTFMNQAILLPKVVQEWSGLANDPVLVFPAGTTHMTVLNDIEKLSFNKIADLIEEQL